MVRIQASGRPDETVSPEVGLLLLCARTTFSPVQAQRAAERVRAGVDWAQLLSLAQRHAVLPLLSRNLSIVARDAVPQSVQRSLAAARAGTRLRNTALTTELLSLLDALREAGVQAIPYKGPTLAEAAWQVVRALWVQDHLNAAPLITVQNPYSLLNRGLEAEMFPMARGLGLGIMAYAPLGTGLLSGAYAVGGAPPPDSLWGSRRRGQFSQTLRGRGDYRRNFGRRQRTTDRGERRGGVRAAQR